MRKFDFAFRRRGFWRLWLVSALLAGVSPAAAAQELALQLDPQHTSVIFTLGDVLHTVRGTFRLKQGSLRLDRASGKLCLLYTSRCV